MKNNTQKNTNKEFNIKDIFNIKNKINIFYLLLLFLPIIDLLTAFQTRFINFSLTIGTIIKGVLLLCIVYYLMFKSNSPKKKSIIIYLITLLLFSLIYLFTKNDINGINSLIKEVTSIFKFAFYPILTIGLLDLDREKIIDRKIIAKILSYTIIMYILLIFIPYITKTGFKSYGLLKIENGTVGWFYSANEIGSILILLFSFIYLHLDEKKYVFFLIFASLGAYVSSLIGTKVSSFGIIIVTVIMLLYYIINKNTDKSKKIILASLIFIVSTISFITGPIINNVNDSYSRYMKNSIDDDILYEPKNKFESFAISLLSGRENFLIRVNDSYKHATVKDKLFGLGFTERKSHYSPHASRLIEMDYFDMFYRFGIIGFILFILPLVYLIIDIIKKLLGKHYKITLEFFKYLIVWGIVLSIGFISGHVLGSPAVSFYLGIITLFMYRSLKEV